MEAVRFDGRTAIVTGAGGGMGRTLALALAARGANVLVNDHGGSVVGRPGTSERAEAVVEEIRAAGGRAVADAHAVGDAAAARAIVAAAEAAFGAVDLLVNNAGIVLPGTIDTALEHRVDRIFATNLVGPYWLTRAVWPGMRARRYGRIVNVSSNAALGIGANAPYAATKAGMIGLTMDTALEGRAANILVNAIMPVAYTRMIEEVPDPAFVAWMKAKMPPEAVSQATLALLAEGCSETGRIFTVGGGRIARVAFAVGEGVFDPALSPESALAALPGAVAMSEPLVVEDQPQEIGLYAKVAPFAEAGRGPGLAADALIDALEKR